MTHTLRGLLDGLGRGDRSALASALSLVEDGSPSTSEILAAVSHGGTAPRGDGRPGATRVGITGPPGAGKSSLTAALAARLREGGEEVGILAVDPSSPYSGGALLGDRVRMGVHATDPGVFVRSVASRGAQGGLFPAVYPVLDLMSAAGFPWVLVETVGAGQAESEIVNAVDTVVALFVPESGDAIQAMKAGIREAADVLVVNKGDRPGAEAVARELRGSFEMGRARRSEWVPPVLVTAAVTGDGVDAVLDAIRRHGAHLRASGELEERHRARIRAGDRAAALHATDANGAGGARPDRIRVLVAKPGLDGHDRGARVVASAFRDAGFEVIYTGLHQTPEMIANAAVQEDADVVALSVLSGAHMTLLPRVKELLDQAGRGDVLITGGGIIPASDQERLRAIGIGRLFGPGSPTSEAVAYVREWRAATADRG